MISCSQCSAQNESSNSYCFQCGSRLHRVTDSTLPTTEQVGLSVRVEGTVQHATSELNPRHGMMSVTTLSLTFAGGESFTTQKDRVNVGRADSAKGWEPELDVTPYGGSNLDLGVSRVHARLVRRDGGYVVVDLGSTNGTYVNGQAVPYNEPVALHDGDTLEFGALVAQVSIVI